MGATYQISPPVQQHDSVLVRQGGSGGGRIFARPAAEIQKRQAYKSYLSSHQLNNTEQLLPGLALGCSSISAAGKGVTPCTDLGPTGSRPATGVESMEVTEVLQGGAAQLQRGDSRQEREL